MTASDAACPQCGTPVSKPSVPAPVPAWASAPPPAAAYPPIAYPPPQEWSYETRRDIDRTKTGVALLAVGSLLGWIPVISALGGLLVLIGAILVILGRSAFGLDHSRNVGIAIGLYLIGVIGILFLGVGFISQLESAVTLPAAEAQAVIVSAFNTFLIGAIIFGIFTGLASVLFLYAILDTTGRVLIWAAFFASLGVAVLVFVIIAGQIDAAIAASFSGATPDPIPLLSLDAQINSLRVLQIIPDLLLAGAAYVAWSRIDKGVIPKRTGAF